MIQDNTLGYRKIKKNCNLSVYMVRFYISPNRCVDCLVNLFDYIRIAQILYGTKKDQIVLFSTQTRP